MADYHCLWSAFVFCQVSKRFLIGDYGALPSLGALFSLLSGSHKFKHIGVVSSEIVGPHVNKAIKQRKRQIMLAVMCFILSQKAFDGWLIPYAPWKSLGYQSKQVLTLPVLSFASPFSLPPSCPNATFPFLLSLIHFFPFFLCPGGTIHFLTGRISKSFYFSSDSFWSSLGYAHTHTHVHSYVSLLTSSLFLPKLFPYIL